MSISEKEELQQTWMRKALNLALRGLGKTSPNPMVGAVLVRGENEEIGEGWHQKAGMPHAEINAINHALSSGNATEGSTLYVTLEPCSTQGHTGACVEAIKKAGIRKVVCAAMDPNPAHQGRGFELLRQAGIEVVSGVLEPEARNINRAFNHWIVKRTPFVTLKSAMSLDGKIATASGESRWITSAESRAHAMQFRARVDAILTGVNTVLADDCSLSVRSVSGFNITQKKSDSSRLRRIILDSQARTPLDSQVVSDSWSQLTTIVVSAHAPEQRVEELRKRVQVWTLDADRSGRPCLPRLLEKLGAESLTHLLVEAGGTLSESFLRERLVQRIHFYYAPKIIGGKGAPSGIGGQGVKHLSEAVQIVRPEWKQLGSDFLLEGDVLYPEK